MSLTGLQGEPFGNPPSKSVNGAGFRPSRQLGPRRFRAKLLFLFGLLLFVELGLLVVLGEARGVTIVVGLAVLALGLGAVHGLVGLLLRPIVQMTRTAERAASGDLRQRVPAYGADEAGTLAQAFNAMLDGFERTLQDVEQRCRRLEQEAFRRAEEALNESTERQRLEKELRLARLELERRVEQRTEELARVNDELHGQVLEKSRTENLLQSNLVRLEGALEGAFRALAATVEKRDPYIAGHQQRVSALAVAIAQEMGLPADKIEGLRVAALIHDIGKIAAPAEILTKPARLTTTEYQLVKEHPRVGHDIIKTIPFPWPVAHIILQHHERLDGSGYPEGLIGDAILMEARILAVADVVEALCALRPYRPALGLEKGLEEVRRGRGLRYDTRAVDACLRVFRDGRFAFKKEVEVPVYQ